MPWAWCVHKCTFLGGGYIMPHTTPHAMPHTRPQTYTLQPLTSPPLAHQILETNQMVEEMMLLANIAVAEKIVRHFTSCSLLRRHPTPAPRQFDPVIKAAASAGGACVLGAGGHPGLTGITRGWGPLSHT